MRAIGPYKLRRELGRGGGGIVYLAEDERSGAPCALKTLQLPEALLSAQLRREIQLLSQLQHPGIVRVFADGEEGGLPWFAMELLDGESLEATCRRGPRSGEGLRRVLAQLARLCEALAFLHGEGVLHRDLKPANLMLRPDGSPVLCDFGLAYAPGIGRETLSLWGIAGTPAYMSPEQLRGEALDARADLYSLGCILYELVTGAPPFGEESQPAIRGHLREVPRPPSASAGELPPGLEALILSLLQKAPQARPGYAEDVGRVLAEYGGHTPSILQAPRPRPYFYRPTLAGRAALRGRLHRDLDALEEGRGALMLLQGESGVGKTRLAVELAQEAERRDLLVILGGCAPAVTERSGAEPLQALRPMLQALADLAREGGPDEARQLLGTYGGVLALYEPALVPLLPAGRMAPVELPPEAARARLFRALWDGLQRLSSSRSLLLVLDDLQWADELTLGVLDFLTRAEPLPVLVLGLYRSEEAPAAITALRERLEERAQSLERLSAEEVRRVASEMLAATLSEEEAQALHRHAEGNPLFLAEYLRAAAQEGLLRRPDGVWRFYGASEALHALPLPTTLRALLAHRVERLSPEERSLAEAAAVLGREADGALLAAVAGAAPPYALHGLLRHHIVEELPGARLRFAHDKLREALYDALSEAQKVRLHHAAALAITARHSANPPYAVLGAHWRAARHDEEARRCYLAGARQEAARFAHAEAERLYTAYLALCPALSVELIQARQELALRVLAPRGRNSEASAALSRAKEEALQLGEQSALAASLEGLGTIARTTNRPAEAERYYEDALAIRRALGQRREEGATLSALAFTRNDLGRGEDPLALCQAALLLQQETQDRAGEASTRQSLGAVYWTLGRTEEAAKMYRAALALHRETGNRVAEGTTLGNLAGLAYMNGEVDEALARWGEALAIHREVGNRRNEGITLGNLAVQHHTRGDLEGATALFHQALALHREVGNQRSEALIWEHFGTLAGDLGRVEEARQHLQRARALLTALHDRLYLPYTMSAAAVIERRYTHDLTSAEALLTEALALAEANQDKLAQGLIVSQQGHLSLARGESAAPHLVEVQALARETKSARESNLGRAIAALERAQRAFEEERALSRGEHPDDIPLAARPHIVQERLRRG